MLQYLINHAVRNVWCTPGQDRQVLLALTRFTPVGGSRGYIDFQWERIPLPVANKYFHVYLIGQNSPYRFNLEATMGVWQPVSVMCQERNLLAEFYTGTGIQLNRTGVWIQYTTARTYIVAVINQDPVAKLDFQPIYCRFYSNAYFDSIRDQASTENITHQGKQILTTTEWLQLQYQYHLRRDLDYGFTYLLRNGRYVDDILPSELTAGDWVEWIFDGSVRSVIDFKLDDLPTFTSQLDSARKYLLHVPKGETTIDYRDDVDIYIVRKSGSRWDGVYYHKNVEHSLRMVTHHDYSIPTGLVDAYLVDQTTWSGTSDIYIRLCIKHAGYDRPLVDEHQRIKELYKLDDVDIIAAMIGLDANVPEWTAAELEKSNYTRIMRSRYQDIQGPLVTYAYGYNAMAKLTADTPVMVTNAKVILPVGLHYNSTIFEYDSEGLLLGWKVHQSGENYYPTHPNCDMVDGFPAVGSKSADIAMGTVPVTLDPLESYRMYVSSTDIHGNPLNNWVDVTGDFTKYQLSGNTLTWTIDATSQTGVVKGDSDFLCYDLTLPDNDGLYKFSLTHTDIEGRVLYIPPGRIDIWMNGRALIENLDYYVNYPEIVVCNKEYLEPLTQQFTIRGTGFCNADMSRTVSTQVGWVKHGIISVDSVYNLRDDKIIRCVVDGKTYHRNELSFAEDNRLPMVNVPDGRPYLIEDVVVPVRGVTPYDTYFLRSRSLATDRRVSDYLSLKLPEPAYPGQPVIPNYYHVYSPLTAKLINDLRLGLITPPPNYALDSEVAAWVDPYLYLLEYDPCVKVVDSNFVTIHPHQLQVVVDLEPAAYTVVERIIRLYLRNRVDLTSHAAVVNS